MTLENYLSWFKHHERFVLVAASLLFLTFGVYRGLGYLERRDQRIYDKRMAVLEAQVEANAATAKQNAVLAQQYADLAKQVMADNTKLALAITARDAATKVQIEKDKTLPPADLATRWEFLAGLPLGTVKPTPGDLFTISDPGARQTVVALETIPQLKADLEDTRTQNGNKDKQVTAQTGVIAGLHVEIDGLGRQIVDADKVCKAETTLLKAQARKSKLKWFVSGAVAGFLVRPLSKIFGL